MSTQRRIYLDWNATAPMCDPARAAIADAMQGSGNPSSMHAEGRRARDRVESARQKVAALVGRPREQIVFTSGGTEANQLGVAALAAAAERRGLPKVVATTPIEHPSLAGAVAALAARGWRIEPLAVDDQARIAPRELGAIGLFAAALVNHELGTILDRAVIAWARAQGALVHVDAVQAAGKFALDVDADAIAISAHKLGGPQGVGALAIAIDEGMPEHGGHQERGRRPGTENVLGIVGFGAAAAAADPADWPRVAALAEAFEARAKQRVARVIVNAELAPRVGGTCSLWFAGARGQDVVMALDLAGISASTGAACTSGTVQPSPVLLALGRTPEQAIETVRFSFGRTTTAAELDEVLQVLPDLVERARSHR